MWIAHATAILSVALMVVVEVGTFSSCMAFTPKVASRSETKHNDASQLLRSNSRTVLKESGNGGDNDVAENGLPQLPGLGGSSLSPEFGREKSTPFANKQTNSSSTLAFVSPKFGLQYTCNVCETYNRIVVSRQAYREGMVIAICKGCDTKHWIADNLDPALASKNIEDLLAASNATDQENFPQVHRVTEDVYEAERVWQFKGGEMKDEDGNPVLE